MKKPAVVGGIRERVREAWPLLALTAVAVFLRIYNLEVIGWAPDTYDRLMDARAIVRGELPDSPIYPPGAALIVAPFFAVLPKTLGTMQGVIVASGVLLVPVTYRWVLNLTDNRRAALLGAAASALLPPLVVHSRGGQYDVPSLLLTMMVLTYAANLRKASLLSLIAYGVSLGILMNVRSNNLVLLPALAIIYAGAAGVTSPRDLARLMLDRAVLVVGGISGTLFVAGVLLGSWSETSVSVPVTFDGFGENLVRYFYVSLYYAPGILFMAPFALLGVRRVWREKPYNVLAIGYLLALWPLLYAPFDFTSDRYMLQSQLLLFCLAAIGVSGVLAGAGAGDARPSWLSRYALLSGAAIVLVLVGGSALLLKNWSQSVAESDEGLAAEFKPAVSELREGSLLVSSVSLVFQDGAPQLDHLDLVSTAMRGGGTENTVDDLLGAIDAHFGEGHRVYYLYSHWEQGSDFTLKGKLGYAKYWDAVTATYETLPLLQGTQVRVTGHTWTLYEVKARPSR